MNYTKICPMCDKKFKEDDMTYTLNICDVCAEELVEYEGDKDINLTNRTNISTIKSDEYECETCGCTYPINLKECEICGEKNPNPRALSTEDVDQCYEYECEACGCTYPIHLEECEVCGEKNPNPRQICQRATGENCNSNGNNNCEEVILGDFIAIDSLGYIHIIDKLEETKYENLDRLKIYINDKVYKTIPINLNEITVGRSSIRFIPTYDLSKIDPENYTSRKHLMLYREEGNVYARNLSSKNTIHINGELLLENESKMLNNNDELILSGYIVTKFLKGCF